MNDEFFATIKLSTGEEILGYCKLDEDGITILNPLVLEDISILEDLMDEAPKGLRLSKWIKSSTDDYFFIFNEKIITMNELIEPGLTSYKTAVLDIAQRQQNRHSNKPQLKKTNTNKQRYHGYRCSTKQARINFEKLFNSY